MVDRSTPPKYHRIALVMSDVFVRRLAPGLGRLVGTERDFWTVDINRPVGELRRILADWAPQGIITESLPEVTEVILELGFPTVIVDSDECFPGVVSMDVDDFAIGELAARHLIDAGHSHFACVLNRTPYAEQRGRGFQETLAKQGFDCSVFRQKQTEAKHYAEHWLQPEPDLARWLRSLAKPTALLAAHDPLGRAVCETARREGISVPETLSVLGVNNDEIVCNLSAPPLSSITVPWETLAHWSVDWLEALIDHGSCSEDPILARPGGVVDRQSTTLLALDDPLLARAIQFIRENFAEGIGVKETAAQLGVNRRTLERRFQEALKRSPREEILRLRLRESRRLLRETDLSMPWIAERCGFPNAERFCVAFRQAEGVPPTRYRSAAAQSQAE
ncbi:MAG: substrate-binding domain-containing protein [Verrucomicrobiota bacterium]